MAKELLKLTVKKSIELENVDHAKEHEFDTKIEPSHLFGMADNEHILKIETRYEMDCLFLF